MDTISPAVSDAFRLLRTDLYRHLDEADFHAGSWTDWSPQDMNTARQLIWDLVRIVRQLLREHTVQDTGYCRTCTTTWPCDVVSTIHALLMGQEHQLTGCAHRTGDDI